MEKLVVKVCEILNISSARTKNIVEHVSYSILYKIGSVLANFLLVPLAITYLNSEKYGIWLTLSSVITWFSFFDVGLGNGLRNKFAEAKAKGEYKLAQAYVSSAYFTLGSLCVVLIGIILLINPILDWTALFNTADTLKKELGILIPLVFSFFCLRLVIKLITSIYLADQHHSIQNKVQFFIQAGSLACIWLLTKAGGSSLLIFGAIYSALPVAVLLVLNLFAFSNTYQKFKPKLSLWKKEYLEDILGLGFRFFIIQIAVLVLFSTDNFIITKLFGPAKVVPYNIANKYFSIVTMAYGILMTPYWSSFTEAYTNNDYDWIKESVRSIQKLWLLVPFGLIIMIVISHWFYDFWVGEKVSVPFYVTISMALFVALKTFNDIYVSFLNGVGKISLQLILSCISIIVNIPLSIYLADYLGLGLAGVILATCCSLVLSVIFFPIQYYKIINNSATGIWNR